MPQIEPRMISNQLQSSVFLYTCQSADVMEIIKKSPSKNGSLSNGVDDLKNLTSEMEWSFFGPVVFSCVFSNWYSYVSTPPAFPLAWIHV